MHQSFGGCAVVDAFKAHHEKLFAGELAPANELHFPLALAHIKKASIIYTLRAAFKQYYKAYKDEQAQSFKASFTRGLTFKNRVAIERRRASHVDFNAILDTAICHMETRDNRLRHSVDRRNHSKGRLGIYLAIIAIFIACNIVAPSETLLQVSFWFLAALILLVPFDTIRFLASRAPGAVQFSDTSGGAELKPVA